MAKKRVRTFSEHETVFILITVNPKPSEFKARIKAPGVVMYQHCLMHLHATNSRTIKIIFLTTI